MLPGILEAKIVVARRTREVGVALAVVGVVTAAVGGWLVLAPGTVEVEEQRHEQKIAAELGTTAEVTGDSSVWDRGTTLRDKPVYLTSATPELRLTSRVDVPPGQDVEVTHRIAVVYEVHRSGDVVWRSQELLLADTTRVSDGNATASTTIDPVTLRDRGSEIAEEFSSVGAVSAKFKLDVNYETDRYQGHLDATGPVSFTDRAVAIDEYPSAERTHQTESTVTRQAPRDWGAIGVLFAIVLTSVLGGAWTRRIQEEDIDIEAVEDELTQRRYEEWISGGRLPTTRFERAVEIRSLVDLVDLAIDSNKRVVDDPEREVYGVIDGTTVYYYVDGAVTPGFLKAVETPEVAADTGGLDAKGKTDDDSADVFVDEHSRADTDVSAGEFDETHETVSREAPENPFVRTFIDEFGEEETDTIGGEESNVVEDELNADDDEPNAVEDRETEAVDVETNAVEEEHVGDPPEKPLDLFVSESDEGDDGSDSGGAKAKASPGDESIENGSATNK